MSICLMEIHKTANCKSTFGSDAMKSGWIEREKKGKLNSNVMLPYVQLHKLLKIEAELLCQYEKYVDDEI